MNWYCQKHASRAATDSRQSPQKSRFARRNWEQGRGWPKPAPTNKFWAYYAFNKNLQAPQRQKMKAFKDSRRKQFGRLASSFSLTEKFGAQAQGGKTCPAF